jgi:hypothetical protein
LVYIVNEIEDGSPCIRRTLEKQGVVGHSHAGWMQGFPIEFANLLDIEKRRSSESREPITTMCKNGFIASIPLLYVLLTDKEDKAGVHPCNRILACA